MARKMYTNVRMEGVKLPPLPTTKKPAPKRARKGPQPKHGILVAISVQPFAPRRFLVAADTRTVDAGAWTYEFRVTLPTLVRTALPTLAGMLPTIDNFTLPTLRVVSLPRLPGLRVSSIGYTKS